MGADQARYPALHRIARAYRSAALLLLNVVLLFTVLNLAAFVFARVRHRATPAPTFGVRANLARVHESLTSEEVDALARESVRETMYEPFTQFREKPGRGVYVNVDEHGFRGTTGQGPWPPDPAALNVFVFGGSTTFNYGVRDAETIASQLWERIQRRESERAPRVYNFGRGAYYSSQELVLLERLISAGAVPHIAIFIDGLNDFFFYDDRPALTPLLEQFVARKGEPLESPWRSFTRSLPAVAAFGLLAAPLEVGPGMMRPVARRPRYDDPAVTDSVLRVYEANRRTIAGIAAAHRIVPVFVWQPIPTYKYDLAHHSHQGDFGGHEYSRFGYPRFAERLARDGLPEDFVWCADVQEGVHALLYVDQVHYGPRLSGLVAECIDAHLRARGL